jgi:hypothetical protein
MDFGNAMKLPHELRLSIIELAIQKQEWEQTDPSGFLENVFPGLIGDSSGFNFPLSQNISALLVNKWIRQEALPFAYRSIRFKFDDMDDFIKFGLSIGRIGRNNVESLELFWLSSSDLEATSNPKDIDLRLPSLHVVRCVQLLKQFKRLRYLRLIFDEELLLATPCEDFKLDSGIRELSSIRGLQFVEVWGLNKEPLDSTFDCAKWLKQRLEDRIRVDI